MKLYDEKTGLYKIQSEEDTLVSFPSVQDPRTCRLSPPFFRKVIRNEFLVGLGKCFFCTSTESLRFVKLERLRGKAAVVPGRSKDH